MRIASINNTNFTHKILVDIGASNPKGTCKVTVKSEDGRELYKKRGYLNNTTEGFKRTKDKNGVLDGGQAYFIQRLDKVIKKANATVLKDVKEGKYEFAKDENGDDSKDRQLSGVVVFVPGTTYTMKKNDEIAFIPNLKNDLGETLVNIDFNEYEKELKSNNDSSDLDVSKDFEFVVTKDLGGAGVALAQVLAQRNELKTGDYIMGVMTGGGFGSVDIKVKGTERKPVVEFETSESSSYLTGNTLMHGKISDTFNSLINSKKPKEGFQKIKDEVGLDEFFPVLEKLGRQGVSVKSHLKCFFEALDLPISTKERQELIALAQKTGDARLVTMGKIKISQRDEALCSELSDCKYFSEIPSNSKDKRVFTLNKNLISQEQIDKARIAAVEDYANSVSLISINKINDCINKVYLVGPFAQGINAHIQENQQDYDAADLPSLIRKKIETNIDEKHADLPSTRRLMKLYNFEIICDPDINFPDNTYAGDVFLHKKLEFTPNRGSWFSIPLDGLKTTSA